MGVMNQFRQAVFLQQNSLAPFGKLPKQQQTDLWESIRNSNIEAFTKVHNNSDLLFGNLSGCKSLAVRLHIYGSSPKDGHVHQMLLHPAAPLREEDAPSTVQDFLKE